MNQRNIDIKNILLTLCLSILGAGLLAFWMIHSYGPMGHYQAANVMLSPSVIDTLATQKKNSSKSSNKNAFVFNAIEFSYTDKNSKVTRRVVLQNKDYEEFYNLVSKQNSLEKVPLDIVDQFNNLAGKLTINMDSNPSISTQTQVFQVVEFVDSGYYRVLLHDTSGMEWAYFYQPNLYQQLIQLVSQYER